MVVLVTGGSGQLGQSLQSISEKYREIDFHFASSAEADITDKESLDRIFKKIKPDFCINAAAYTAVDKAESEPEKAFAINVTGAQNLAETCNVFKTVLIHISTDFVFDGNQTQPYSETDATNPQGVYGLTKLQGEVAISVALKEHFIIRTSWLYSEFGNNFMKTMLRFAKERESLNVVDDQIGTPTYAVDLAEAIVAIIKSGKAAYGIYNFSNEGTTSWYGFAKEIFAINAEKIILNPIPTTAYPTPAKRPKYSVLDKTKIKEIFGIPIKDWKDSLRTI
ncbi:MAG TPA: dTDP-4-dehydrorhamnose reductase [Flavobacterium sp.]|nr:dTDP-4-dehydrorhamnose reductase [Flavobacterium sp.]